MVYSIFIFILILKNVFFLWIDCDCVVFQLISFIIKLDCCKTDAEGNPDWLAVVVSFITVYKGKQLLRPCKSNVKSFFHSSSGHRPNELLVSLGVSCQEVLTSSHFNFLIQICSTKWNWPLTWMRRLSVDSDLYKWRCQGIWGPNLYFIQMKMSGYIGSKPLLKVAMGKCQGIWDSNLYLRLQWEDARVYRVQTLLKAEMGRCQGI